MEGAARERENGNAVYSNVICQINGMFLSHMNIVKGESDEAGQ